MYEAEASNLLFDTSLSVCQFCTGIVNAYLMSDRPIFCGPSGLVAIFAFDLIDIVN